ncbi:MAG: lectin-like protein [Phormidesmis sp.]
MLSTGLDHQPNVASQLNAEVISSASTHFPSVTALNELPYNTHPQSTALTSSAKTDIDRLMYRLESLSIGDTRSIVQRKDKYYLLTQETTSWEAAQAQAKQVGGNLVTINDAAEDVWLQRTFGAAEMFWMGLSDRAQEGVFTWASGETTDYLNWAYGEPNDYGGTQDYGAINFGGHLQWDDEHASRQLRGIIEIDISELTPDPLTSAPGDKPPKSNNPLTASYQGSQYIRIDQALTWEAAQAKAREMGGHLVTINDAAEYQWLQKTFGTDTGYWMGLSDRAKEGHFGWQNNENVTYTNWAPGEPNDYQGNQDYGRINFGPDHLWDDADGEAVFQGIVEIKLHGSEPTHGGPSPDLSPPPTNQPPEQKEPEQKPPANQPPEQQPTTNKEPSPAPNAPKIVVRGNSQYQLTSEALTWEAAQAQAQQLGGHLVTINNAAEDKWLSQTFGEDQSLWMGLTDRALEGHFKWASGESVTYTNWAPTEPNDYEGNQDYGRINVGQQRQWDDGYAHTKLQGIIEVNINETVEESPSTPPANKTPDSPQSPPSSQPPENKQPENDPSTDPTPDNKSPDNKSPDTPTPKSPNPESPEPDNKSPENPSPENPSPENPAPDNKAPENPIPQNPTPQNPTPQQPAPETPEPENKEVYSIYKDAFSREVPENYSGYNANAVEISDWGDRNKVQALAQAVKGINAQTLRIPGGDTANYWDWDLGGVVQWENEHGESRAPWAYPYFLPEPLPLALNYEYGTTASLDNIKPLFTQSGAEPIWVVNMNTSHKEKELRHLKEALDKGFSVERIELGNELYFGIQNYTRADFGGESPEQVGGSPTARDYAQQAKEWALAIRNVPGLQNATIAVTGVSPLHVPEQRGVEWWPALLEKTGPDNRSAIDVVDAFTLHPYYSTQDIGITKSDVGNRQRAGEIAEAGIEQLRHTLADPALHTPQLQDKALWITEHNIIEDAVVVLGSTWLQALMMDIHTQEFLKDERTTISTAHLLTGNPQWQALADENGLHIDGAQRGIADRPFTSTPHAAYQPTAMGMLLGKTAEIFDDGTATLLKSDDAFIAWQVEDPQGNTPTHSDRNLSATNASDTAQTLVLPEGETWEVTLYTADPWATITDEAQLHQRIQTLAGGQTLAIPGFSKVIAAAQ